MFFHILYANDRRDESISTCAHRQHFHLQARQAIAGLEVRLLHGSSCRVRSSSLVAALFFLVSDAQVTGSRKVKESLKKSGLCPTLKSQGISLHSDVFSSSQKIVCFFQETQLYNFFVKIIFMRFYARKKKSGNFKFKNPGKLRKLGSPEIQENVSPKYRSTLLPYFLLKTYQSIY